MSTESGIPDFRSNTGIYSKMPEEIFSRSYFFKHPDHFYEVLLTNLYKKDLQPNIGHNILAEWEQKGLVQAVITQNTDSLHINAGSKNVIEIHGHKRTATCQRCGKQYVFRDLVDKGGAFYYCDCLDMQGDNLIKPDTVLYEENVPRYGDALSIVQQAELIVVLGTSLTVYPVAGLIDYAPPDTPVVIINKTATSYDNAPRVTAIHESIGATLSAVNEAL